MSKLKEKVRGLEQMVDDLIKDQRVELEYKNIEIKQLTNIIEFLEKRESNLIGSLYWRDKNIERVVKGLQRKSAELARSRIIRAGYCSTDIMYKFYCNEIHILKMDINNHQTYLKEVLKK